MPSDREPANIIERKRRLSLSTQSDNAVKANGQPSKRAKTENSWMGTSNPVFAPAPDNPTTVASEAVTPDSSQIPIAEPDAASPEIIPTSPLASFSEAGFRYDYHMMSPSLQDTPAVLADGYTAQYGLTPSQNADVKAFVEVWLPVGLSLLLE